MAAIESVVPLRRVKRVQFGILSPEEIVSHPPIHPGYYVDLIYLLNHILNQSHFTIHKINNEISHALSRNVCL